ncbi:MAG: FRG domain-containing protein [Gammaproteobacteria bacterium AqS3]|nr:FRG domain-containing protein [Gammaproteobacteria bacterium AqS3]
MSKKEMKYYERLPSWPDFAFPNNKIDGLLPSCRVDDWEHFMECMRNPRHHGIKQEMIYRGQRRYDWGLSSTLARAYKEGRVKDDDREELLEKFKLAMRGRGPELKSLEENEVWAYGQHNGLHTPLLDWSRSPFVALYFAFVESDDDREEENSSRAIFCLDMSRLIEVIPNLFYEPVTNENARLVSQAGLFTITPSGQDNFASHVIGKLRENNAIDFDGFEDKPTNKDETNFPEDEMAVHMSQYLCKIHIPNTPEIQEKCLVMLRQMNIHHGSLFPDPLGAATYAKDWLHRKIIQDHAKEEEKRKLVETRASTTSIKFSQSDNGTDVIDLVKNTVQSVINEDIASDETVLGWAPKIAKRYNELETIDWPLRSTAQANIRTNIFKLLVLLGAGSSSQILTEELVEVFEADYRSKHNLNFGGQGNQT